MSHLNLTGVMSQDIGVRFYDSFFSSNVLPSVSVRILPLPSLTGVEVEASFHIETEIKNIGKIRPAEEYTLEAGNITVDTSISDADLAPVYGPVCLINYRETVRYEILGETSVTGILFNESILFLGEKKIAPTKYIGIKFDVFDVFAVERSFFKGILHKANNAKAVGFQQLFYVGTTKKDKFFMSPLSVFPAVVGGMFRSILISDTRTFPFIKDQKNRFRLFSSPCAETNPLHAETGAGVDLSGATYRFLSIVDSSLSPVMSVAGTLSTIPDDLDDATYSLSSSVKRVGLGGFLSGLITVVRLLPGSPNYRVVDLAPYYSESFQPSIAVYADGALSQLQGFASGFARWIDHGDRNPVTSAKFNLRVSVSNPEDLDTAVYPLSEVMFIIIPRVGVSLSDYLSPPITIETGSRVEDRGVGLYRNFIASDFGLSPYRHSAWFRPGSEIVKLSPWRFVGISPHGLFGRVSHIAETKYITMNIDFERIVIQPSGMMIRSLSVPRHFKISQIGQDNTVLIAMSISGGSVLHIGNESGVGDPYFAEAAAREIASLKYTRHAQILHDIHGGATYYEGAEEESIRYLTSVVDHTDFFSSYEYSPWQISQIIATRSIHGVNNSFFVPPAMEEYGGVRFAYPQGGSTEADLVEAEDIVSYKLVLIQSAAIDMNVGFEVVSTATPSKYIDHIEGCGVGTPCSNYLVSTGSSDFFGVLSYPNFFEPKWPGVADENPTQVDVSDVTGTSDSYYTIPSPTLFQNLLEETSAPSRAIITIGNHLAGMMYPGHMTIGTVTLSAVYGAEVRMSVLVPNENLSDVYSEFRISLKTSAPIRDLSPLYTIEAHMTINQYGAALSPFFDRIESIWMKMFFPQDVPTHDLEAKILEFDVISSGFSKEFDIPFAYVDDLLPEMSHAGKASPPTLKEKRVKEIDDILGGAEDNPDATLVVCGPERNTTYLEYRGFNHVLNFNTAGAEIWGNHTSREKEIINSPYMKIAQRKITLPGTTLSNAEGMSHSMVDAALAHIENLDVVYDWKIEDFALDKKDLVAYATDASSLSTIQDSFASSIRFVTTTLGEELTQTEAALDGANRFPEFPARKADDGFLDRYEVHQHITVYEKDDDV